MKGIEMSLPKYIVVTKTIKYDVSFILEDNEPDIDPETVTLDELVDCIDELITSDFGNEEPLPDITFEY